jgi:DNA processing protein
MKAKSARGRLWDETAGETPRALGDNEKRAWLRLIRTPHIGGVTFWELLSHFGSASAALEALPKFTKYGSRVLPGSIPSSAAIDAELEKASAAGMSLVAAGEPDYPPLLAHVVAPPPLIYIKGSARIWECPPVAIVGSRHASAAGLKLTEEISTDLCRRGFSVVSGLARGIDAAAHRAALPFSTCAILPGGLDAIYPPDHAGLAAEIAQDGLLISECPPGFAARAQDFPRRNRIISGCCLGVVVIEAAERSGSLITARLAGEQNREVFAVPGHPLEPRAAGANGLIKDGAVFTTCGKDVEDTLQPLLAAWNMGDSKRAASQAADGGRMSAGDARDAPLAAPSAHYGPRFDPPLPETLDFLGDTSLRILQMLSLSPVDVDDLCRLSGLDARYVHAALLSLDLSGRIERRGFGQVALKP